MFLQYYHNTSEYYTISWIEVCVYQLVFSHLETLFMISIAFLLVHYFSSEKKILSFLLSSAHLLQQKQNKN
jgi:hypothetical protein